MSTGVEIVLQMAHNLSKHIYAIALPSRQPMKKQKLYRMQAIFLDFLR